MLSYFYLNLFTLLFNDEPSNSIFIIKSKHIMQKYRFQISMLKRKWEHEV